MNANHVNVAPLVFTVFAALVVSCAAGTDGVDKLILPTPVSVEVKQGAFPLCISTPKGIKR